jgi:hypothetical protein
MNITKEQEKFVKTPIILVIIKPLFLFFLKLSLKIFSYINGKINL